MRFSSANLTKFYSFESQTDNLGLPGAGFLCWPAGCRGGQHSLGCTSIMGSWSAALCTAGWPASLCVPLDLLPSVCRFMTLRPFVKSGGTLKEDDSLHFLCSLLFESLYTNPSSLLPLSTLLSEKQVSSRAHLAVVWEFNCEWINEALLAFPKTAGGRAMCFRHL